MGTTNNTSQASVAAPRERLWNSNYLKVWSANFMIFFSFMLLTPLLPSYLSDTFGADKQTIGIVLSGYTLTALLIRALSGYMVDSFPRRVVMVVSYMLFALFFAGYLAAGTLMLFAIVRTLHGAPFGATTVSNSTVAIDVLPASRRAEGIGYYGLSNNIATAISPTVALVLFEHYGNYDMLFWLAFVTSLVGLACTASVKHRKREVVRERKALSLDRSGSAELPLHYGDILYAMGEKFMAETYWRRALEAGADPKRIEQRMAISKSGTKGRVEELGAE